MKPVSEWTDAELRNTYDDHGIGKRALAAEVLRLREQTEGLTTLLHDARRDRDQAEADLAAARAELRECEQDRMGIANWHRLEKAEERVEDLLADLAAARADAERLTGLLLRGRTSSPLEQPGMVCGAVGPENAECRLTWGHSAHVREPHCWTDAYRAAQGGAEPAAGRYAAEQGAVVCNHGPMCQWCKPTGPRRAAQGGEGK